MAFLRIASIHVSESLEESLANCAVQTIPNDLALDDESLRTRRMRPPYEQIYTPPVYPILPIDVPAAVEHALETRLQQQLRPGLSVAEPLQRGLGVLPEEFLKAG